MKRKWIIIGSSVLAALVAFLLTRNEPKSYRSTTRISTGFAVPDEIKVSDNNLTIFDAEIRFNNAISTWTSPSVVSLLSYDLILHDLDNSEPFRGLTTAQLQSGFYKGIDKAKAKEVFRNKLETMTVLTSFKPAERDLLEFLNMYGYGYNSLSQRFQIYPVQRTDYIEIDCTTENPELSAFIVNNLYSEFIRYYRSIRSSKSQESVDTLRSIMEKKKQVWDDKTRLLKGEGIVDASTESSSKQDLIADLEKMKTNEKSKLIDDYNAMRRLNQRLNATSTTGTKPDNGLDEQQQAQKAMNEVYLEYQRTNDKATLNRYNQLKADFQAKYGTGSAPTDESSKPYSRSALIDKKNDLEAEIDASNDKIRSLDSQITGLRASVSSVNIKGANVETMMEEAKLAEKDYFDAKQKYDNAMDMSSASANNFRQLQVAQPAIEPEPSKRMFIVGMAGAVTFILVILIIFLLTYLDSSIRTPNIFQRVVNLKLISMVNFMNLKNQKLKDIVAGHTEGATHAELNRGNVFRESIRKLRYEIETSGKKIVLFTSTKKGQGKTTLIQALSYSMSLSKKKILIIDTNFCNPDLTIQLNADPVLEKISVQNNNMSMVDRVKFFSKDVGAGGVFVIGSEGGDYTPSEVLPRENLLTYLHSLAAEFDYIFLEGPPLNDFSDSKELIHYVDGVVAVFAANHVIKQIDKESIKFFKDLNGKFCGSVLNMINLENVNAI
jgi:Mrp family chromosome partitioning ATPase/uncharacterized protein involved in exopolysaccharide biosynthesis